MTKNTKYGSVGGELSTRERLSPSAFLSTKNEDLGIRDTGPVNPHYTIAPVAEGQLPCGLPEFCRLKVATAHTGLSRAKLYQGINEGWVRSVSLRKKGQKFAVRLVHLPSLVQYLHSLMAGQQDEMILAETSRNSLMQERQVSQDTIN